MIRSVTPNPTQATEAPVTSNAPEPRKHPNRTTPNPRRQEPGNPPEPAFNRHKIREIP